MTTEGIQKRFWQEHGYLNAFNFTRKWRAPKNRIEVYRTRSQAAGQTNRFGIFRLSSQSIVTKIQDWHNAKIWSDDECWLWNEIALCLLGRMGSLPQTRTCLTYGVVNLARNRQVVDDRICKCSTLIGNNAVIVGDWGGVGLHIDHLISTHDGCWSNYISHNLEKIIYILGFSCNVWLKLERKREIKIFIIVCCFLALFFSPYSTFHFLFLRSNVLGPIALLNSDESLLPRRLSLASVMECKSSTFVSPRVIRYGREWPLLNRTAT